LPPRHEFIALAQDADATMYDGCGPSPGLVE
jgi:hypothetical protein